MTASFTIRAASPRDLDQLMELVRLYYLYDGITFDGERIRPAMAQLLDDAALGRVWLASSELTVAGYMVVTFGFDYEFGGRTGLVTDLYICDAFRRQGLGTRFMEHAQGELHALHIHAIELHVERDNDEARALYTKLGFHALDRIPMTRKIK